MFKNSFKSKNYNSFKEKEKVQLPLLNIDFLKSLKIRISVVIENDFSLIKLPDKSEGILIFTEFPRNPNDIIKLIEAKEGLKSLVIVSSRISGCTFLEKCNLLITNQFNKKFKQFRNHAKIILINDYVLISSSNLNKTNASVEQLFLINDKCLRKDLAKNLAKSYKDSN